MTKSVRSTPHLTALVLIGPEVFSKALTEYLDRTRLWYPLTWRNILLELVGPEMVPEPLLHGHIDVRPRLDQAAVHPVDALDVGVAHPAGDVQLQVLQHVVILDLRHRHNLVMRLAGLEASVAILSCDYGKR